MEQQLRQYIHNTKKDWNYITPLEFYEHYYLDKKKKDTYVLIDLRKKKEFDKYHIKGAQNIFWLDLLDEKNLKSLPRDKTIFLICYVGHTSSQAMVLLKLLGYSVVSIKFGYGVSPAFKVPVAGWTSYNLPVHRGQKKCAVRECPDDIVG
jgi:rhodanese-related sulfurtransferase